MELEYFLHIHSHEWNIVNENAKCRVCGYKAFYGIVDVECYGSSPVEVYGWSDENGELLNRTCEEVLMDQALK